MEVSLQSFKKRFTYDPQKDLLGKGGFGEVYKAYDTEDHIFVALKISQGTADDKYNLINEIKRFKKLNHPNIVKHIEAYEVNTGSSDIHGKPIAYHVGILEYANNGTLADLLKKGTPDYRIIEDLAKDIIEGLAYLHSENIIHRDLKPTNILLFSEGEKLRAKITDFGIAKRTDATAASTQLVGTVEYMAPEFFSTGNITPASDVWSVGVMLLEALTGTHPFGKTTQGLSNAQIINNILNKDLSTVTQNLHAPFKEIITRCFLRETNLRPQSATELKGLLQQSGDSFSEKTQVIDFKKKTDLSEIKKGKLKNLVAGLFDFDMKAHSQKIFARESALLIFAGVLMVLIFYSAKFSYPLYCKYRVQSLENKLSKVSEELNKIEKESDELGNIIYRYSGENCLSLEMFNSSFTHSNSHILSNVKAQIEVTSVADELFDIYVMALRGELRSYPKIEENALKSFTKFYNYLKRESTTKEKEYVLNLSVDNYNKNDRNLSYFNPVNVNEQNFESWFFTSTNPYLLTPDPYEDGPFTSKYKTLKILNDRLTDNSLITVFNFMYDKCYQYNALFQKHDDQIYQQKWDDYYLMNEYLKMQKIKSYKDFVSSLESCYSLSKNSALYMKCYLLETAFIESWGEVLKYNLLAHRDKDNSYYFHLIKPLVFILILLMFPLRYFIAFVIWLLKILLT